MESEDSFSFGNWENLDSQGWYLWRSRHGRKQYWKLCKTSLSAPNFHWCFGDENHNFTVSILQKAVPAVLLQHASLICGRDECKKPLHLVFYYSIMQGSENCNNSFILIVKALNESLKVYFSTFGSYCGCFRLKFETLNFNLRSIKEKAKKPPKPPPPFKMQGLVTVTAPILWLPYPRLVKAYARGWGVRQDNSKPSCAETFEHKHALWTPQRDQVCGRDGEGGSRLPCNPTESSFPMGITHSRSPISAGSSPALGAPLVFGGCENRLCTGTQAVRWVRLGEGSQHLCSRVFLNQPGWDPSCDLGGTRYGSHLHPGRDVKLVEFISSDCRTGSPLLVSRGVVDVLQCKSLHAAFHCFQDENCNLSGKVLLIPLHYCKIKS